MTNGLKRGKWVAGRTVGLIMKVASRSQAFTEDEWLLLGEEVERCANQAVDEAAVAARAEVVKYLRERASRHEHGASGSVIADVLRDCAHSIEITP